MKFSFPKSSPEARKEKRAALRQSFHSKNFRRGSYRAGLTILVLAIVVMVNLVLGQSLSAHSKLDLSDQSLYNISKTTKKVLKNLSDDITITLVADDDTLDPRIEKLAQTYADASKHVTLEILDPVAHPAKAEKLGVSEQNMLVTDETTGQSRTIAFSDIITYNMMSYYSSGSAQEDSFDGEGQLTAAIQALTSDSSEKVYLTEGHGEGDLASSLTSSLTKANLSTDSCNLLMDGSVPNDCSLLLINAPSKDFDQTEIQSLQTYMDNGGHMLVFLGTNQTRLTNLYAFLQDYGLKVEDGYIADTQRCYQQNYYNIFPTLNTSNEIASSMADDSLMLVSNALGMTQTDPKSDNITVTPLLTTSENGYLVTADKETQGTYLLGATAVTTKTNEDGEESTVSKLSAISAGSLIDSSILDTFSNLSNSELFMNTVTWNFDSTDHTSIPAKSLQVQYNSVSGIGLIALPIIFLIPILFLVVGLIHWMRRRKA